MSSIVALYRIAVNSRLIRAIYISLSSEVFIKRTISVLYIKGLLHKLALN